MRSSLEIACSVGDEYAYKFEYKLLCSTKGTILFFCRRSLYVLSTYSSCTRYVLFYALSYFGLIDRNKNTPSSVRSIRYKLFIHNVVISLSELYLSKGLWYQRDLFWRWNRTQLLPVINV